ncbi:MAG: tetratricopeptide repeat protein [Leptospiraceae bacterium]|nr:tetratricopeptide repeat protein [Leptospiraceae bacterium]MDW7976676.1 tetratricopeptide repeat protein [Leptospiraceae bacterium]
MKYIFFFIIASTLLFSCQAPPKKEVTQLVNEQEKKLIEAKRLLNQANLEYQNQNYLKAIQLSQESLKIHTTFDGYYLMGISYYRLNELESALDSLKKAEVLNPNHEQLLLTLGLVFSSLNDVSSAIERFERLVKLYPKEDVYVYRLGLLYKETGNYEKAIPLLEELNREDFVYRKNVLLLLADIYYEKKDFQNSSKFYQQLEAIEPKSEYYQRGKAQLELSQLLEEGNRAFLQKQWSVAERNYKQIIEKFPKETIGYTQLGILYYEQKRYPDSVAQFQRALEIQKNPEGYSLLCKTFLEMYQLIQTKSCLEEGLSRFPNDINLQILLGLYYEKRGEYRKAISQFIKLLQKDPHSKELHKKLYLLYLENKDFPKAKYHLEQFLKHSNLTAEEKKEEKKFLALQQIQNAYEFLKKNDFKKAKSSLDLAHKTFPFYGVSLAYGDYYFQLNDNKLAEKYYLQALEEEKTSLAVHRALSDYYRKTNQQKYQQFKETIKKIASNQTEFASLYNELLIKEKQYDQAIQWNMALKKQNPQNQIPNLNLALVYYHMAYEENQRKNFEKALEYIQKSMELDPENPLYTTSKKIIQENQKYKNLVPILQKAEELYTKEEYTKAKELYQQVYQKWKKPMILVRLAEIEFQTGNEVQGFKLLTEAQKNQPDEVEIQEALYTRLIELKRFDEAEKGFREIIKKYEDAYFSYYKLGIIKLHQKKYSEALVFFEDSLLYKPDFFPAKVAKGVALYHSLGDVAAKKYFEDISREDSYEVVMAKLNSALISLNQNEYDISKKELQSIIKYYPKFSEAYYYLSYLEYKQQNYIEAERLLKKAIELKKRDIYYWGLLRIYEATKKTKEVQSLSLQFLRDYPDSEFYERVKKLYENSTQNQVPYEVFYSKEMPEMKLLSTNEGLFFYTERTIAYIQRHSEKIIYKLTFNENIKEVAIDYYLWVVSDRSIVALEIPTGKEVKKWEFSYKVCKVIKYQPLMIVLSNKDCDKEFYIFYKDNYYTVDAEPMLYHKGHLILKKENQVYKQLVENKDKNKIFEKEKELLYETSNGEMFLNTFRFHDYFLIETNKSIYLLRDFSIDEKIPKLENREYLFFDNTIVSILKDTEQVEIYHFERKAIWSGKLPKFKVNSLFYRNDNLYFIDNTNQLQIWKIQWENQSVEKKVFPETKGFRRGLLLFYD